MAHLGAGALGSAFGHAGCVLGSPALGRRSALRPAPTRTCTTARSTTTPSSDQSSRDTETSLPHSRTMTPSTLTATRSHRARLLCLVKSPTAVDGRQVLASRSAEVPVNEAALHEVEGSTL